MKARFAASENPYIVEKKLFQYHNWLFTQRIKAGKDEIHILDC